MKYLKSSLGMFLLSGFFILAAGLLDDSGYKATKFALLAVSALSFFVGLLAYLNHGLAPISEETTKQELSFENCHACVRCRLHSHAGIEGGTAQSARRTLRCSSTARATSTDTLQKFWE